MNSTVPSVAKIGAAAAPVRADATRCAIERFDKSIRPRVRELAAAHCRYADLALSFPAILFALARPRRNLDVVPAMDLILRGAPLATIAAALELPLWLRRVPTEAFVAPLPRLPDSASLRRQLLNHLPKRKRAAFWWRQVTFALMWGREDYAIWLARELATGRRRYFGEAKVVLLWAWFSMAGGSTAHALIDKPWTPDMKILSAIRAAELWSERVQLLISLGDGVSLERSHWPVELEGYTFTPLLDARAIEEEATAMSHCIRYHEAQILRGAVRVWSVRLNGARVATLEVRWRHDALPWISQLQGPSNTAVPIDTWRAARKWLLHADEPMIASGALCLPKGSMSRRAWTDLWRPYWLDRRRIPTWLPLCPKREWHWDIEV